MEAFITILGDSGIIAAVGIIIFLFSFKYSNSIFEWIENQTFGTRNYILEQLEKLFIDVKSEHITYALLFLSFGMSIVVIGIFGLLSMWWVGIAFGIIISFIGWKIPKPIINFLIERRIKLYQNQMVDALTLLANGIRAGLSMPQSLGMVVDEMPIPISQEFNLVLQQNKIGVPLEECFEGLAKRIPTEDNDMFVSGVNILRETGGNLAETFDTIVGIIRERIRLQQKIDAYVAQGMFQGATIFMMPFAIGGIYAASDPDSMVPLFTTPLGIIMLLVALAFDLAGGFVILKIVKIKI